MSSQYLTTKEVSALLRINPVTLHRLTHNGTIKGFKIGGKILYRKEDIAPSLKEITQTQKPANHGQ